jgi:hypothetical protein
VPCPADVVTARTLLLGVGSPILRHSRGGTGDDGGNQCEAFHCDSIQISKCHARMIGVRSGRRRAAARGAQDWEAAKLHRHWSGRPSAAGFVHRVAARALGGFVLTDFAVARELNSRGDGLLRRI